MFTRLRQLLSILIGDFSWKPPGWLAAACRRLLGTIKAHQLGSAIVAAVLLLLSGGGWWGYHWYRHLPKPKTVSVRAEAPGITPVEKDTLRPEGLWLKFGESVAKLEDLKKKPIGDGVVIVPTVEGTWSWATDDRLVFHPKNDWPAGQKYRVILSKSLFPDRILLEKYEVPFETPKFAAEFAKSEFYTDPTDPAVKQVTATVRFTHSVDATEFEKLLSVEMIGGTEVFKEGAPRFTVNYGPHRRIAYVRTCPLTLPEQEDFLRITVPKGLHTTQGGAGTDGDVVSKVRVPDLYSFFRIESAEGMIVSNKEGEPEQILTLKSSTAAKPEDIQKSLRVYLLPKKHPKKDADDEEEDKLWKSAKEVDEAVLQKSTLLPVKLVPSDEEEKKVHLFKISLETDGQLYVTVAKGTRALGGFMLGEEYEKVMPVPELPREVAIEGEGGVLALNGERKLSIRSRGVKKIEYRIARVPADQINHLVSQTEGAFQKPEFRGYTFNEENIARIATETQTINMKSRFKANYSMFDFGKHLQPAADGGSPMQGLFFLRAREWKPPKKKEEAANEVAADRAGAASGDDADDSDEEEEDDSDGDRDRSMPEDNRFILVTDLGLIVKENADESRDVFVASIRSGEPVVGVEVQILAKNGVPLVSSKTGPEGRVTFASVDDGKHEKKAVAIVARNGSDVAFMPYSRDDRRLDFSRFSIDGVQSVSGTELDAFAFTERGIYRPGDEIHIGIIVKQRNWLGKLEGLPIETEILDARGTSVQVRKLALPAMGFAETSYQTAYESPTGVYQIHVYLVRNGKRDTLLASASANVKEFLPDRMKIESHLSKETKSGWITPDSVKAAVTLRNLYGTPATDRKMTAHLVLSPTGFHFDEYPDFDFFDRLRDGKDSEVKTQRIELGDATTDAEGTASFSLDLERFEDATYACNFYVEGFEAGSGRSVSTQNTALVSALPYVVGFKADGDLSYVTYNSQRFLRWIAVNPALEKIAVSDLECRLIERTYISVLTKQDNGNYEYQSVLREQPIRSTPVSIPADGLKYDLPTDVPGEYVLELRDKEGLRLSKVSFSVVGRGQVSRSVEKNAELQVKLSRKAYNTGDDIEVSIVAPYIGSGLITIERDKVYAQTWFKADRNSSVQHIRVPEGFEGTGYVNVCFVRGLDSKEIFMSPLSYAVVPFRANLDQRRLQVGLKVAEKAKPGEPLRISYKTDRPARIAIFAVDQGILQVTGYELPDPLSHFFRKEALMVDTSQIVDLILPEYSILRHTAAFGGDDDAKHLNPFKRVTEKPVVFWSGIVDSGPREREVVYEVPDYFSGTLTVMAVAMSPDATGSTQKNSLIRGPFVVTPSAPTMAAPGDQFDVSVTVANDVVGSGKDAPVRLVVQPSEHLEILKSPPLPLHVPEGAERSAVFTVRAKEKLGSASLLFRTSLDGVEPGKNEETRVRSTLSVRPAVPFVTEVRGGNFTRENYEAKTERQLLPDFAKRDATISGLPLGLARGLDEYLKNYPNGCSEQLTSGAFCRLTLSDETDFGLSKAEIAAQMERTFSMLRRRQNDQGSFGYWGPDGNDGIDFISVYVMHFLIEAKEAGFNPPQNVFQSGLHHLQAMVALDPGSLREARIQAYAIYLLTREGVITTNYLLNLRDTIQRHHWEAAQDLTNVYLAGSCVLLKKAEEGEKLIKTYRLGTGRRNFDWWDFYSALGADSQYVSIVARHFPDHLKKMTAAEFETVLAPIGHGEFNTLSAAYAVMALKSYSKHLAVNPPALSITEIDSAKRETALHLDGGSLLERGRFSPGAVALRFTAKNQARGIGAFYQFVEAGYDRALPIVAKEEGIEVTREIVSGHEPITNARLGEPITVKIRVRSARRETVTNAAILDLLPGGFEIASDSLHPGSGVKGCDYVEVREDRVVFFTSIGQGATEITYQIKPTACGEFTVPPIFAESMYERKIYGYGMAGKITVTAGK